jgi:hypothetical protein
LVERKIKDKMLAAPSIIAQACFRTRKLKLYKLNMPAPMKIEAAQLNMIMENPYRNPDMKEDHHRNRFLRIRIVFQLKIF